MAQTYDSNYSLEGLIENVLSTGNRDIDVDQTYGRYLEVMREYKNKPKSPKNFKNACSSSFTTEVSNKPFERFKRIEVLGLVRGTKVLYRHNAENLITRVKWITPICIVGLEDRDRPVLPWFLTVVEE